MTPLDGILMVAIGGGALWLLYRSFAKNAKSGGCHGSGGACSGCGCHSHVQHNEKRKF